MYIQSFTVKGTWIWIFRIRAGYVPALGPPCCSLHHHDSSLQLLHPRVFWNPTQSCHLEPAQLRLGMITYHPERKGVQGSPTLRYCLWPCSKHQISLAHRIVAVSSAWNTILTHGDTGNMILRFTVMS